MPLLIQQGATLRCPHGGAIDVPSPGNLRVLLNGQPALLLGDTYLVSGCSSLPPCRLVVWTGAATRVAVKGRPVLLLSSAGLCTTDAGIPQGPALVLHPQTRVTGV
jgi:hypothetical protein